MFCSRHNLDYAYSYPAHFGCPKCGIYHELSALLRCQDDLNREHRMYEMCLRVLQNAPPAMTELFAYRLRHGLL